MFTDYYYMHFKKDRIFLKFLVYGAFLWEAGHSACVAHDAFEIDGREWGDPSVLDQNLTNWLYAPVMTGIS